ncbi:MAG TPA: pyruvate kinase [Candidatus Woesebacteria bacterium]|jgi:pyruvate kinase|nr:pyruvate kinase [Candidatus Shapirobacteria bacterium]HOR02283.1 pyruvate kinase [Candidatus Woesebacteria bacterium]
MDKKTKIIATVGPASDSEAVLEQMIIQGVDIFRFNLKHNSFEWHRNTIKRLREVAKKIKKRVAVMVDFQGPEIRVETKDGEDVEIKKGDYFWIGSRFRDNKIIIKANPTSVVKFIKKGEKIFLNDGDVELTVIKKDLYGAKVRAESDFVVKNRKSLNLLSEEIRLPILADRDKEAMVRIDEIKPDYIALSFVRDRRDIEVLKELLKKMNLPIKVIGKIENMRAIKYIDEIISASDGIMIARGDLGIEVPTRELAFWQKKIIDLCRIDSKPVIVATQMLISMVKNNRPSRAEATDVSNAIFDGTDALMLSEETSIGKHPIKVIKEMKDIAYFSENTDIVRQLEIEANNATEVLVDAAVKIVNNNKNLKIGAVIIFTQSGNTARIFSRYRLNLPVVAVTDKKDSLKGMMISYGVKPILKKFGKTSFKMPKKLIEELVNNDLIKRGDNLLVIHGNNWMESGSTSDISLVTV